MVSGIPTICTKMIADYHYLNCGAGNACNGQVNAIGFLCLAFSVTNWNFESRNFGAKFELGSVIGL
jgi:hypothetical protein